MWGVGREDGLSALGACTAPDGRGMHIPEYPDILWCHTHERGQLGRLPAQHSARRTLTRVGGDLALRAEARSASLRMRLGSFIRYSCGTGVGACTFEIVCHCLDAN